ncbi:MAG TPA: 2Fe-2S iron-sulfur cluster-binding protein, partial [Polyangiaceae bacterium]|nr:2Fe-2S iron-sulfur cluster-binding protein [Polyangiaceae bacterium]
MPAAEHPLKLTFDDDSMLEIGCRPNEDVISAALRQGILLVSDCRAGTCGACRAYLEAGSYAALLEHSPHALSELDEEQGYVLACRLQPPSALHLRFDYAGDRVQRLDTARHAARIVTVERASDSVLRVVLRTLASRDPLAWLPGQYVRLEHAGQTRAYSLANLPNAAREPELFVRLVKGGG